MAEILYAAYGSNLHWTQFQRRCPGAKPIGMAKLDGYKLTFRSQGPQADRWWGVANVEKAPGASVPVGLWLVNDGEHLKALDAYEGFPRLYTREHLTVRPWQGRGAAPIPSKGIQALVYFMVGDLVAAYPTTGYEQTIVAGYRFFGIPGTALRIALKATENAVEEWQADTQMAEDLEEAEAFAV